jgi:hypothetical protein
MNLKMSVFNNPKKLKNVHMTDNEENEEIFESGVRTLPLCFASFKLLKQNVNNVSDQKPSRHDVESEESNRLANESYLPLCFSSFELLRANHEQTEKVGKSIVVQSHLPSSEIDEDIQLDFQQNKVFQSCLSPPVNDVVVQILSGLDVYEGSETPSMETLRNEQTNDIEFQGGNKTVYVMIQSEMQKDHKEAVVLLDSFEDYGSKTEEEEKRKPTLVKMACPSVLVHRKEIFSHMFHDPVACYMESFNNQNLQLMMGCKLRDEDDGQSTSVLDMDFFLPGVSFQPTLSSDSEDCYFQQSQQIFQPLGGNQQVKSHERKNAVEKVKHDCCFVHVLKDPFAVLLETVNSPNIFEILRFEFIYNFSNGLSVNRLWSKHVQSKQAVDKMLAWLHWHYDFT